MKSSFVTPFLLLPLFALALVSTSSCGSESSTEASPEGSGLVIQNPAGDRPYFFDFGDIPNGTKATHTFEIKNTDSVPVAINDLQPACSCSTPAISYIDEQGELVRGNRLETPVITLPPGVVAQLTVEVDTNFVKVKNIDKLSSVSLRCDSVNTPYMHLELHLVAIEAYQVTPTLINLKNIPVSSGKTAHADVVTAVRGSYYRILGVLETSEGLVARLVEREGPGEIYWQVQAVLSPPLEKGPYRGEIKLRSTGAEGVGDGDPLVIKVTGQIVDDVMMFPQVLGFNPVLDEQAKVAEGTLTALAPGHRIKVVDAFMTGESIEGFELNYEAITPDSEGRSQRWRVTVTPPANFEATMVTGSVQLTLDDPEIAPIEARFVYRG